jgi:GNAT superfamily N-acetyltransferase
MQDKPNISIRRMQRSEMDWAIELAAGEGWNPGLHDAEYLFRHYPEGFLTALEDDRPAGCISAVSYAGQFGFIGFFVVLPQYRGSWVGFYLAREALRLLKGQNSGLDGVMDKVDQYAKLGFRFAYNNIRFESISQPDTGRPNPELCDLSKVPFEQIAQYDRRCFPAERRDFLKDWLNMPDSSALGLVSSGILKGFGVIRQCRSGYKIGPLFADDGETAERLYLALTARTPAHSPVYLDVPEPNQAAMALAEKYHMQKVFMTARMYSRGQPEIELPRIFGITTFELG